MDDKKIGLKIKDLRKQTNKMTQKEFASLIGKNIETVKKYESGKIQIPLNVLNQIAKVFNVDVLEILYPNNEEVKNKLWKNIIFIRNKFRISQEEMSNKLNISLDEYLKYETEQEKAPDDILLKISNILSVPPLLLTQDIQQQLDVSHDYNNNPNSVFRNNQLLLMYVLSNMGMERVRTSIIERICESSELKDFMEYLVYKYDKQIAQERKEGE